MNRFFKLIAIGSLCVPSIGAGALSAQAAAPAVAGSRVVAGVSLGNTSAFASEDATFSRTPTPTSAPGTSLPANQVSAAEVIVSEFLSAHPIPVLSPDQRLTSAGNAEMMLYLRIVPWSAVYGQYDCTVLGAPTVSPLTYTSDGVTYNSYSLDEGHSCADEATAADLTPASLLKQGLLKSDSATAARAAGVSGTRKPLATASSSTCNTVTSTTRVQLCISDEDQNLNITWGAGLLPAGPSSAYARFRAGKVGGSSTASCTGGTLLGYGYTGTYHQNEFYTKTIGVNVDTRWSNLFEESSNKGSSWTETGAFCRVA